MSVIATYGDLFQGDLSGQTYDPSLHLGNTEIVFQDGDWMKQGAFVDRAGPTHGKTVASTPLATTSSDNLHKAIAKLNDEKNLLVLCGGYSAVWSFPT